MRVISLLYHNVVKSNDSESRGMVNSVPGRYALEREEFARHLEAIARARSASPSSISEIDQAQTQGLPLLLTFDDGELGAYTCIADLLESHNWRGHFFIPTNYIGTPRFLTAPQIRHLRKRGHVIGSHTCSHPERMARCSWTTLTDEWARSVEILSDLIGEQVTAASVPGGQYSRKVAEAACAAGIKALFNSEPVTRCHSVDGCMVLGRYTILGGTLPSVAAGLAASHLAPRLKQSLYWNLKKIVRRLGGEFYERARNRVLKHELLGIDLTSRLN